MRIWRLLNRQGVAVARCTVERLMRELGITGAVRGKRVITMVPDTARNEPRTSWTATASLRPRTGAGSPTTRSPRRSSSSTG
ncbi:IS3 family transposase [Streptomyces sp. NPDC054766]